MALQTISTKNFFINVIQWIQIGFTLEYIKKRISDEMFNVNVALKKLKYFI